MKQQLVSIICLLTFGTSQAQIESKKWYGEPNRQEILLAAEPGADDTHFWAAGTIANGTHDDFWLVQLNPQGEKIWSDTLGRPDRNEQLWDFSRNPATGEMWLIGESRPSSDWLNKQVFLQKLDADGGLIFEKLGLFGLLEDDRMLLTIKTAGDGALVFHHQTGILRRLDAAGEVVWERSFTAHNVYFNQQNIAVLPDGGCYFTDYLKTSPARCALHRLAADGQTIWQNLLAVSPNPTIGSQPWSVVADLADTSVFVAVRAGSARGIQKFAADGQLVWKSDLPFEPYQNDFLAPWLLQMPAKNRIALFSNHAFQVLDDQTGAVVATENNYFPLQKTEYKYLNDGVSFADGTLAVVGTLGKNPYDYDGFSAKMSADDFQILQQNTFGISAPNDTDYESRVETAADGGSFLANMAYFDANSTGIALRKISADGSEIWKKGFDGSGKGYWNFEMRRADDGNLFLMGHGGDSVGVIKLNPDGGLIWQRHFKMIGNIATVTTSAPLKNGGIVVFHPNRVFQPNKRFWEARAFDQNGNQIWVKRLFEGQIDDDFLQWGIVSAADLGDRTLAAVGNKFDPQGLVVRLDLATGAPVFEKFVPNNDYLQGIFPTADGSFLTIEFNAQGLGLDSFNVFKINGQGDVSGIKNLPVQPKDFWYVSDLFRAPDGSCVVSALSEGDFLDIFKLNDNLDLLDQKSVNLQANTNWISGQTMLSDGSFLLCGEGANQNSGDVFLIKTGKTGIVSSLVLENEVDFQVFPNPVADGEPLQILLENDYFGTVKIEVLSLDVRVLQTFFEEKTTRTTNVGRVLNPSDVAGTAFFVRVSDGKTSATRLVLKF